MADETTPKDEAELERRKVLAGQLKEFAQKPASSPNTAEGLMSEAGKVGVSREQMSGLYKKYAAETPTAETPAAETPAAGTPTTPTYDAGGLGTPDLSAAKSYFSQESSTPTAPAKTGPSTPGLDRQDAMQGSPMGSTSTLNQTRSLESETGKGFRMARKLQRLGFKEAAGRVALGAASVGLNEPNIKTEEYRRLEAKSQAAAASEAAANEALNRKRFDFQSKLLEQQNKDLASGQFDYRKYAPST
jgi:hypothetical protein